MWALVGNFRLHQEAVALAGNSLDVQRLIGGIAERLAEFVDGSIYVGVVVDMRIGGPEPHAQFFAGDDFTRFFEKGQKNLINLPLELEPGPVAGNFLPLLVNAERPKQDIAAVRQQYPLRSRRLIRFSHRDHFRRHRRPPLWYIDVETTRVFSILTKKFILKFHEIAEPGPHRSGDHEESKNREVVERNRLNLEAHYMN